MRNVKYQVWSPRPHELVALDGDHLVTDTQIVAKEFGKQHKNVTRIIDAMRVSETLEVAEHARLNFEPCIFEYQAGKGSKRKVAGYRMSKDGLSELAMSFTGDRARVCRIRFIAAFNAMAEQIANGEKDLWQKMQALIAKETASQVKASFGSHLMLKRKRELPGFRTERHELEAAIQPTLLN